MKTNFCIFNFQIKSFNLRLFGRVRNLDDGKYAFSGIFLNKKSMLVLVINESETLTFHNDMRFLKGKASFFLSLKIQFLISQLTQYIMETKLSLIGNTHDAFLVSKLVEIMP